MKKKAHEELASFNVEIDMELAHYSRRGAEAYIKAEFETHLWAVLELVKQGYATLPKSGALFIRGDFRSWPIPLLNKKTARRKKKK